MAATLAGQCATWLRGNSLAGTDGHVLAASTWDPDGAGPMPGVLFVGGHFLCEQVVSVEYAAGAMLAVTGTNALARHIGSF